MRKSQLLTIGLSMLVGYLLAMSLNRTTSGQPPVPRAVVQEAPLWRYQLTAPGTGGFSDYLVVTDTVTGHCWVRTSRVGGPWQDLGTPADQR